MQAKRILLARALLGGALVLALAGCNTVDRRIEKNQAFFDSLPIDNRQLIRDGRIAPGFSPREVEIALGKPDDVLVEEFEGGERMLWVYTRSVPVTIVDPFAFRSSVTFSRFGRYRVIGRPFRTIPTTVEEFQLSVSFTDGQATSILRPDTG
ncbi:MAG: hypothetical protein ACFB20_02085 [Opitutales bacterium]